jgi:two-component system sensor histidine kinase RpfC
MLKLKPELRGNPEFQSALVRIGIWIFAVGYVGLGALTDYYRVETDYYVVLFAVYLGLFVATLVSVIRRPVWAARRYAALVLDISAVSFAIFLTKEAISPFYLLYIWIFISAGTRYGRTPLTFASVLSLIAYNLVLVALGEWERHTFEAIFFLLLLVLLPLYQYSLLRKVQEARLEAEKANKAKGDFLAVMTHELRTPLTGVLGMAHLLKSTRLSGEQRGYVESIVSSAEVLRALIGDVLDLSKIDARKLALEAIPFDLRATVLEVCHTLDTQALNKGLELVAQVDPRLPAEVTGDQLRVRQILFNLMGNAIKFTEEGEVGVRVSVAPPDEAMALPEHVLLEVEDTGIGIPEAKIGRIFDGFVQADDSTTRRYGGTGLGTTIARDLTRLMGGRIGVQSEEGKGSRFWVRLPLLPAESLPERPPATRRLAGRRALVLEENATVRRLILEIAEAEGMACVPVADVGQLSRVAGKGQTVDLLILGDSPAGQDLDGLLGLFRRVLDGSVPHLFLTYPARRAESEAPCSHCLNKPFLAEQLVAAMLCALAEAGADAPGQAVCEGGGGGERFGGVRVLVAEDNDIAAKVITTLLAKQGAEVTLVGDGEQALARARDGDFALAFVDLRMPRLDGIELTRALRAAEPPGRRLPIVALTANAAEDVKAECLAAGMDDFLGKPVRPQELTDMVSRYAFA